MGYFLNNHIKDNRGGVVTPPRCHTKPPLEDVEYEDVGAFAPTPLHLMMWSDVSGIVDFDRLL